MAFTFVKFVKEKELNKKFGSGLPTDPLNLTKQNLHDSQAKSCMTGEYHKYILKPSMDICNQLAEKENKCSSENDSDGFHKKNIFSMEPIDMYY